MSCRYRSVLASVLFTFFLFALLASAGAAEEPPALAKEVLGQQVAAQADDAASVQELYLSLAGDAGVDVAFAPELGDARTAWSAPPRGLAEALDELARRSRTFWVATGPRSILVADDTPQMRRTYEPQVVASIPLRHAAVADVMTLVRSIYGMKHVAIEQTRNVVTLRDSADRVALARALIERHDVRPPRTLVELELIALEPGTGDVATRAAGGRTLLAADTSIVGQGEGRVRVERSPLDADTWLGLAVDLSSRAEDGEIRLDLRVESSVLRRDDENSRAATRGSWRSRDGAPFVVRLPLHVGEGEGRRSLALRVTPEVVDAGEPLSARSWWIGTETAVRTSIPTTAED